MTLRRKTPLRSASTKPRPLREFVCQCCDSVFLSAKRRTNCAPCGHAARAKKLRARAAQLRKMPDASQLRELGVGKRPVSRIQLARAIETRRPIRTFAGSKHPDPEIRFADAVAPGPIPEYRPDLGPCLIYLGAPNGKGGYGQFRYGGKNGYAHRYAWEREEGAIPDGLTVDHLCRVRLCVRRSHLELVTGLENYLRAVEARDECPNGHLYTSDDLLSSGRRRCRRCAIDGARRGWAKRSRSANGLPNRRIKYDQVVVREQIARIRRAECTIAEAARVIGCNHNYLGRRTWEEVRRDVLNRDGSCCRCGATGALDAHHRRPRKIGGRPDPATSFGMANIIALCRICHQHVESHRAEARRLGFLIPGEVVRPEAAPMFRHLAVWVIPGDGLWIPSDPPLDFAA